MTTRQLLLSTWAPSHALSAGCGAAVVAYGVYFRERLSGRFLPFVAAIALFFVALASPIGVLARGYLFSAHMLQHLILLLGVPALLTLGRPEPSSGPTDRGTTSPSGRGSFRYLLPWLAGVGGMWLWHERSLCDAAVASGGVQALQTASLVAMGLAFWRPILSSRVQARFAPFPATLYLFTACAACTVLGILIAFSPVEVCSVYAHPIDRLGVMPFLRQRWGLSPVTDQRLGGLLMWVPACLIYLAAILATLARYYREEETPSRVLAPRLEVSEIE